MEAQPKPQPGLVNCLGVCGKKFKSKDKIRNRVCPACARKLGSVYIPKSVAVELYDNGGKRVSDD